MADPIRLLDDPALSPLGRSVLASATEDAPSADARSRVARKLGVAVAVGSLAAGGEAAAVATGLWWKVVLVVVALGGATSLAVREVARDRTPATAPVIAPATISSSPAAPELVVVSEVAPPEAPSAPVAKAIAPAPVAVPAPVVAPVEPAPVVPPAEPAPVEAEPAPVTTPLPEPAPAPKLDARRLAAEVALLDRARDALTASNGAKALVLLDEHAREFADGMLHTEAALVRIEALVALHRGAEARQLGERFLANFPHSPLAKRVRSLITPK